jgi:hypothetical protein
VRGEAQTESSLALSLSLSSWWSCVGCNILAKAISLPPSGPPRYTDLNHVESGGGSVACYWQGGGKGNTHSPLYCASFLQSYYYDSLTETYHLQRDASEVEMLYFDHPGVVRPTYGSAPTDWARVRLPLTGAHTRSLSLSLSLSPFCHPFLTNGVQPLHGSVWHTHMEVYGHWTLC